MAATPFPRAAFPPADPPVSFPRAAGATDPGLQRDRNEDRFHLDPARGLYMVVDGVGGQAAGGEAATLALSMLRARLERETGPVDERVREAITVANNEIHRAAASRPEWAGMACVLTVAVVTGGVATIGHVGDTRLYKIRHGRISKITRDHSPVGEREDAGEISELDAMRHPRRNEVYRDVGSEPHQPGDADFVDITAVPMEPDAALVLCSDGLTDLVPASAIASAVAAHAGHPDRVVRTLVQAALDAGGKDNVTAVYAEGEAFASAPVTAVSRPVRRMSVLLRIVLAAAAISLGAYALVRAGVVRWPSEPVPVAAGITVISQTVAPGESIASAIERALVGSQVVVEPGEYREQLRLRDGVRVVSRVPRGATIRLPGGAGESDAAVVAIDVHDAGLSGFRIVGDAATPLGTGLQVHRSTVSIVDVEVLGALTAAVEFGAGAEGSFIGGAVHDNPGAGLVIRAGASPRITHSGFATNGMSERATAPVVVEPGATPTLDQNVFTGVGPDVFLTLDPEARAAVTRDNWFPGVRVPRPEPGRGSRPRRR